MAKARKPKDDGGLDFSDDALFSGAGVFDDEHPESVIDEPAEPVGVEQVLKDNLDRMESAFQKRAKAEAARFQSATDSEYWCALVFESRAQKEAFLKAMGWLRFGDKYLDGCRIAEEQEIDLPDAHVPYVAAKPSRSLDEISQSL